MPQPRMRAATREPPEAEAWPPSPERRGRRKFWIGVTSANHWQMSQVHFIDGKNSACPAGDCGFSAAPWLPAPAFKRMVDSILHERNPEAPLEPGEFVLVMDCKVDAAKELILKNLPKKVFKHSREYGVVYDEIDMEKRQERIMLETSLRQREILYLASAHPVKLVKAPRMYFSGTNKGTEMFPVPLRDWDEEPAASAQGAAPRWG